jgi:hypothetical protein
MKPETAGAVGTCIGLFVASLFIQLTPLIFLGIIAVNLLMDGIWK